MNNFVKFLTQACITKMNFLKKGWFNVKSLFLVGIMPLITWSSFK